MVKSIGKILNLRKPVAYTPQESALRWDAAQDAWLRRNLSAAEYEAWHWALAQNDDDAMGVTELRKKISQHLRSEHAKRKLATATLQQRRR